MSLVPKYENVKAENSFKPAAKQTAVECLLRADEGAGIRKVLSVTVDATLISCEAVAGEARYTGKVDFKALFENNEGGIGTMSYFADFSDKAEDERVTPLSELTCALSVADVQIASADGGVLKMQCVIEAAVTACNTVENKLVSGGEGFYFRTAAAGTSSFAGKGKGICDVTEEIECRSVVRKILLSDASVIITDAHPGVDSVTVSGEVCVQVSVLSEDGISAVEKSISFSCEIDCRNVLPGDKAFARGVVRGLKIGAMVDEGKGETVLTVTAALELSVRAYSSNSIGYVDDVFCPDCMLGTTYMNLESKSYIASYNFTQRIEGVAGLDEDMMPADRVAAVCSPRVHVVEVKLKDGAVTVEGIAAAAVLYTGRVPALEEGGEETEKIASVNVEIPFSQTFELPSVRASDAVDVAAILCNITAKSRKGKEIEVDMTLKIRADLFTSETLTAIADVEAGDETTARRSAVSLYYPSENETLWDIAKQLMVSPDTVAALNPTATFPVGSEASGTRILVYRQK